MLGVATVRGVMTAISI